jgi:hypothetical protein
MELILAHRLPATWLLQFDALATGPYVDFLKAHMAADHEVGFWFEMNELLCLASGVEWRGRADLEWDSRPSVAFTIGYRPEERITLADAAMDKFRAIWGKYPSSVASWNLDSITMSHLTETYGIDAFAVCRDQIATDGFTIWGAPIAGYFPSRTNCWSPALRRQNQILSPVFRMLGQDPVYYYYDQFPLPGGEVVGQPDTMEPVWTSGRSANFVKEFLRMISEGPCMGFAYAQMGQENNFGWPAMADAYPLQMNALAQLRDTGSVHVETLGETGRRFKHAFQTTPVQAQVQLGDPFGNTDPSESSIWYQSRFYRADLHIKGDLPFLRDLTVYSDHNPQPFLTEATRQEDVEQRMPAILDGYHWSKAPGSLKEIGAGGFFQVDGQRLRLTGKPQVREEEKVLKVELPVGKRGVLCVRFQEESITLQLTPATELTLSFEWDPAKAPLPQIESGSVAYHWQGIDYLVGIGSGVVSSSATGWTVSEGRGVIRLKLAQAA